MSEVDSILRRREDLEAELREVRIKFADLQTAVDTLQSVAGTRIREQIAALADAEAAKLRKMGSSDSDAEIRHRLGMVRGLDHVVEDLDLERAKAKLHALGTEVERLQKRLAALPGLGRQT